MKNEWIWFDLDGTIADLIIAKTAKIGEKLSLRRIEVKIKTQITRNTNKRNNNVNFGILYNS